MMFSTLNEVVILNRGWTDCWQMEGSKEVDGVFPDALREPILRKVQFSTISRIDNLGEYLHNDSPRMRTFANNGSAVDHIFDVCHSSVGSLL